MYKECLQLISNWLFYMEKTHFFFQTSISCFKPQNRWKKHHYANKPKVLYQVSNPTVGPVDSNGHALSPPIETYDMSLIG